jgi:hypothetical protein
MTFTNLFGSPRIVGEQGTTTRERRGAVRQPALSSLAQRIDYFPVSPSTSFANICGLLSILATTSTVQRNWLGFRFG